MSTPEIDLARHDARVTADEKAREHQESLFKQACKQLGLGETFTPWHRDADGYIQFGIEWNHDDVLDSCHEHPAFSYLLVRSLGGSNDAFYPLQLIFSWAVCKTACDALGIEYDEFGQSSKWLENEWQDIENAITGTYAEELVAESKKTDEVLREYARKQMERREAA